MSLCTSRRFSITCAVEERCVRRCCRLSSANPCFSVSLQCRGSTREMNQLTRFCAPVEAVLHELMSEQGHV